MNTRKLLGLSDLLHDAIEKTSVLVQGAQDSAARRTYAILEQITPLAGSVHLAQKTLTAAVHSSIRATSSGLRTLEGIGIAAFASNQSEKASRGLDRAQAALNALYGDFLQRRESGLATLLGLYDRGVPLPVEREALRLARPEATGKICILVHGLGCTEWEWTPPGGGEIPPGNGEKKQPGNGGKTFGELLERDLGYTSYSVRYNSGLHVSENGRALAKLIEDLVREHPVPVSEIALIGHSMGGLVVRSAGFYGSAWNQLLKHVVCLGSPHLGAPLEKAVHLLASTLGTFEAAGAKVPAQVLQGRSAGIKDLRYGYVVDDDWLGKDPDELLKNHAREIPLVESAAYCFVAACLTRDTAHPLGQLFGDALVRMPSASGDSKSRHISFHFGRVLGGLGHLDLQYHPQVYEVLRGWLAGAV
jgi:pimeloyl-ACP methyl ester carboxylesterase